MTRRSLRARLALAALLSITLALLVASLSLVALFERHVERRIGDELTNRLNQLAAAITVAPDGAVSVQPQPTDPRFQTPLSGLYWQVDDLAGPTEGAGLLRSRSLWDFELELPRDRLDPGAVHAHVLPGPGQQRLLVRERSIRIKAGDDRSDDGLEDSRSLRLAVAQDQAGLISARNAFAADMLPYLGVIGLVLGLATWMQIRIGLAPLESVRQGVNAVRAGETERLPGTYPDEVQPLVDEVDALLAAREQAVEQARGWTADLAHGLKTPLTALAADAERLRREGNPDVAGDLEALAEHMRRRVDRELIRVRVRAVGHPREASADVGDVLRRLVDTLRRTPDGARLDWRLEIPLEALAAITADDLMELMGNLLENAAKWARKTVQIDVVADDRIRFAIADDGPGVPSPQLSRLGERGLRLDERKAGSGLGLAIARDIIEAYDGSIGFAPSPAGGLTVDIALPRIQTKHGSGNPV